MRKSDVEMGASYTAKVSGKITCVRIVSESRYGGWNAVNEATGREVRIKTAGKLRRKVAESPEVAGKVEMMKEFVRRMEEAGVDPVTALVQWGLAEAGVQDGRMHDAALVIYAEMNR